MKMAKNTVAGPRRAALGGLTNVPGAEVNTKVTNITEEYNGLWLSSVT